MHAFTSFSATSLATAGILGGAAVLPLRGFWVAQRFSRCGDFGWCSGLPLRGFWVVQRFTTAGILGGAAVYRCGDFGWRSGLPLRGFWVARRFTAAIHTLPSSRLQPLRRRATASDIVPQALKRQTYITAIGTSGTRALPDLPSCRPTQFSKLATVGFGRAALSYAVRHKFSRIAIVGLKPSPTLDPHRPPPCTLFELEPDFQFINLGFI